VSAHDHPGFSLDGDAQVSVVRPGEGHVVELGPIRMTVKEDGSRTRGTLAVIEFEAPGVFPSPVPHVHRNHEEGFYILEGELEFTVGTEKIVAPAGTFVMVPIGVPHTFGNARSEPVRFVATMSPDFYVRYFEEIAPLFAAGRPDSKAVGQIMARYATEPLP
jgi:mannose-6-phosphate isomerase-like protein (cupin superfamily)